MKPTPEAMRIATEIVNLPRLWREDEEEVAIVIDRELNAWRPIADAPKDGSQILAFDGVEISICSWSDCSGVSAQRPRKGWATHYDHFSMSFNEINPTHFRPLPSPPIL